VQIRLKTAWNLQGLTALLILVAFFSCAQYAGAGQTVTVDAGKQFNFAEHLFAAGEFMSAVNEYHRFIFLFPQDHRVDKAMFRVGECYKAGRQFDLAVQSFTRVIDESGESAFVVQAYYKLSDIYLEIGRPASAITTLHNLATIVEDPGLRDESYYRIGWIYLDMGDWELARASFDTISHQNREKYRVRDLNDGLASQVRIKKKHPATAGMLSIIPGGGYLYCERYQDALIAFLVNGGLIYAAYEAFDHDMIALGGVIAFVEVGFYSGNIYGAVSSAHKYNQRQDRTFIDRLRKSVKINLSTRPAVQGMELALKFRF
jgi:tetratricopeptide (TPR) repeat protein